MKKIVTLILAAFMSSSAYTQCTLSYSYVQTGNSIDFTLSTNGYVAPSIFWDFDDGSNAFSTNPTHAYTLSGGYEVCVTLTDSAPPYCTDTYCDSIYISNSSSCNANFSSNVNGFMTTFSDASSGTNLTYVWDFGDGSVSTQQNPTHTYGATGSYVACLDITSSDGCTDSYCDTVVVTGSIGGCLADFSWTEDQITGEIFFSNSSLGSNLTYSWIFGDGATSNVQNPSHIYANIGAYHACLTVTQDSAGVQTCSSTLCDSVFFGVGSSNSVHENEGFMLNALYPNPADEFVNLMLNNVAGDDLVLLVTDIVGKTIYTQNIQTVVGDQMLTIDLTSLESGMYKMLIISESKKTTKSFIKI